MAIAATLAAVAAAALAISPAVPQAHSVLAQIFFDYRRYVAVLKWLTLCLFAYVGALAVAKVNWGEAISGVLIPHLDTAIVTTAGDYNDLRIFPIVTSIAERIVATIRR